MSGFGTTRWSLILAANDSSRRATALDRLCRDYRPPVVAWLRGRGLSEDEAEDHAQSFFAHLIEKNLVLGADPALGRFRAYLITSLRNFYSHEREAAASLKRGGGASHVAFEEGLERSGEPTPDEAFDRDFALALLDRALSRLRFEVEKAGRGELFGYLKAFLLEPPSRDDYEQLSRELSLRRNTLAVAVHRLRRRLKEIVQSELMDTVGSAAALAEELRTLRRSIGAKQGGDLRWLSDEPSSHALVEDAQVDPEQQAEPEPRSS